MRAKVFASRSCWAMAIIGAIVLSANATEPAAKTSASADQPPAKAAAKAQAAPDGRELFTREWLPNDSRAHGGDGLGPVFNDSSCVACHNQGGIGGGGAASKNVDIITAFPLPTALTPTQAQNTLPEALFNSLFGALAPPAPAQPNAKAVAKATTAAERKEAAKREKEALAKIHPAFASTRSVVLHHFGTDPKYQEWRSQMASGQFQQQAVFSGGIRTVAPVQVTSATVDNDALVEATVTNAHSRPAVPGQPTAIDPAQIANVAEAAAPAKPVEEKATTPQTTPAPAVPTLPPPAQEGTITFTPAPPQAVIGTVAINGSGAVQTASVNVAFGVGGLAPTVNVLQLASVPEIEQLQNEVRMNRGNLLGFTNQVGNIQISRSQRNATALFGIGKIDAIPEKTIIDLAKEESSKYPAMAGRPSKQKDGHIGRFGWKAQKPTLEDFALTACAVELGLNVPGHDQAGVPLKPDYKAPGLDMNKAECDALVGYLKRLPTPVERKPANGQEAAVIASGHKQFEAVGCANCHVQKVGDVTGLYSDLLLHDMGPELGDTGNYGIFINDMPEEDQQELPPQIINATPGAMPQPLPTPDQLSKITGALRQEWRTPPLWGVRDSGPYLHDGRADTLEQAIAFHGGQAAPVAIKFFQLKPEERQAVIAFLKSLTAPEAASRFAMK